jgi:hypothetical protein
MDCVSNTLGHCAKVNEIEVILWICPVQLGIIDLKFAASCQHWSTTVFRQRTHQFGGTLFDRAISSLSPTLRLVILTISAEVGYTQNKSVNVADVTNCNQNTSTYLRSMPKTSAEGCLSAISMAQIPVPVPTSRMRCGLLAMGALCSSPPNVRSMIS